MVLKFNRCSEEGPTLKLLCAHKMQQSVTEMALQFCNGWGGKHCPTMI